MPNLRSNWFPGLLFFAAAGLCACNSGMPVGANSLDAAAPPDAAALDATTPFDAASSPDLPPAPDDVSATLDPIRKKGGLPALGAAVFRGSQLIAIGMSGVRKQGDPTPATISDQWHLGSDTKAMTATLIGLYVDKGKIHFDDTIATLFAGEKIDPGYAGVTIEQLLQHRGGAPGNIPQNIWAQMWADGTAPGARLKAALALLALPPAQAPGNFVYANAGYMIAGAALERVTGATWDSLIGNELFGTLHMTSCGFGAPGTPNMVDEPWGHQMQNGVLTPISPGPNGDNPPSMGPAGTVHCSLADWGKFLAVHLAGARGEATIASAATMKRLQTPPQGGDYAAGWIVTPRGWANGLALTHTGSNTLWYATAWLAPANNMAYAVVTNRADGPVPAAVDSAFGPLIQAYPK